MKINTNLYLAAGLLLVGSFSLAQNSSIVVVDGASNKGSFTIEGDSKIIDNIKETDAKTCTTAAVVEKVKPKKDKPQDICANQQKILGVKIQILYTKDRDEAYKLKSDFESQFPLIATEVNYASPNFRLLAGDYFTKKTAASDFSRVKKTYKDAQLIEWRVWCRKAQ